MTDFPRLMRLKADDENMEKLHVAARKGLTEDVQRLISLGVDPVISNRFGCTALHLACKFGQVDTAKYLASVSDVQTMWHGQKPLHLAVLSNKMDLVQALVSGARECGRSVEAMLNESDDMEVTQMGTHHKHCKGQTALHWCVALGDAYLPMLKLLLQLGGSPTAKDKEGETVLMRAMELRNDDALQLMTELVPASALRLDVVDHSGRSHLHWAILHNYETYALHFVTCGHDLNVEDEEHVVPLYLAIRAAMVQLTDVLLRDGDPFLVQNAPFHNGTTVLPERIQWLSFAQDNEEGKKAVVQSLQGKLDEIVSSLDLGEVVAKKKKPSLRRMKLAPSAPMRSRSKTRTSSVHNRK